MVEPCLPRTSSVWYAQPLTPNSGFLRELVENKMSACLCIPQIIRPSFFSLFLLLLLLMMMMMMMLLWRS